MALVAGCNNRQLSFSQLKGYAQAAGFSGVAADIVTAIAMAESGGNTCSWNPADPYGGSFGVVQINGSHFQSGTTTQACALDPACAFKFAYGLSAQGTKWTDWGTYTNGSYLQYLNQARGSAAAAAGSGTANTVPTAATGTDPLSSFIAGLSGLVPWLSNPARIAKMIVGIGLLIVAIVLLVAPEAEKVAAKVVLP